MRILVRLETFILLAFTICDTVTSRFCLEGSDCKSEESTGCGICEGAACVRVFRPARLTSRGIPLIALTCLPRDSFIHAYNPDGCKTTMHGDTQCICSHRDYCNLSPSLKSFKISFSLLFVSIIYALLVF